MTYELSDLIHEYEIARQALADGHLADAGRMFEGLVQREPREPRFHFGWGLCLQHEGRYQLALSEFAIASLLNPSDAATALRLGECLDLLGHAAEAKDALEDALKLCQVPGTDPRIREWAEARLALIN